MASDTTERCGRCGAYYPSVYLNGLALCPGCQILALRQEADASSAYATRMDRERVEALDSAERWQEAYGDLLDIIVQWRAVDFRPGSRWQGMLYDAIEKHEREQHNA